LTTCRGGMLAGLAQSAESDGLVADT
jgi:hypothetical protein